MNYAFIIAYGHLFVAMSGPTADHGYEYVPVASKAMTFGSREKAEHFLTESGPGWAKDMYDKGLIRVMRLVDGKAESL